MHFDTFHLFGLSGTGLIIFAVLCSVVFYRGRLGERFSLLNHFVSELGEVGVSRLAGLFNISIFLGGLALLPYMIGLGLTFNSILGWIASALGIITSLACSAVGLFPMNNLSPHRKAAMTFFRAGLIMITFFGLAILFQPTGRQVIIPSANLLSLLAISSYAGFLTLTALKKPVPQTDANLDPQQVWENRPKVSLLTIFEWAVFFTTIFWIFGIAFFLK